VDGDGQETEEEWIRMLAQWAVNVVDFRDPDSIMTPFEFDTNPSDGWDVDGRIDSNSPDNNHPDRHVVWGCERPELLITETLAFHDRRTSDEENDDHSRDEADDGEGSKVTPDGQIPKDEDDEDFDQKFMPRDAFFVELYNPWNGDSRRPAELYTDPRIVDAADFGLQLDRRSQEKKDGALEGDPVWRLLIVGTDVGEDENRQSIFVPNNANSKFRDPDFPDPERSIPDAVQERSVYFVSTAPGIGDGKEFSTDVFSKEGKRIPALWPGGYAVIGSSGELDTSDDRYISYMGDRVDGDKEETRRIELDPFNGKVEVLPAEEDNPNRNETWTNIESRTDWPPTDHAVVTVPINLPRSLSVSEPVDGYDRTNFNGVHFDPPRDVPLDADLDLVSDFRKTVMMQDGTTESFRIVHLQRLANPLQPHDRTLNPYLTIDSMTVNLKSFNGRSDQDPNAGEDQQGFTTLQRGDSTPGNHRLWAHEPSGITASDFPPEDTNLETNIQTPFDDYLKHTLGFLNRTYGPPLPMAPVIPPLITPSQPFPWLTWFNRPFVSQYELLQVPRSSSSRLLSDFTLFQSPGAVPDQYKQPFGHLLNFLAAGLDLHHIFEYLHVPSRFAGTTIELDANIFQQGSAPGTEHFKPPFNVVSRYREPGRVNINTIYSRQVFDAVFGPIQNDDDGEKQPSFEDLVESRRGYDGNKPLSVNSQFPTFVVNPFRTHDAHALVPLTSMQLGEGSVAATMLRPAGPNADGQEPLFSSRSGEAYNDTTRNSCFHYEGIQRLGNLVTTRSNVYAIWITVGYFQVDPTTGAPGQEIGLDTNEIRRHRAFYMVDRSIPVAFEPGQNHNVDRAVLIRRFIE
jgi:hypothetical protein